VDTILDVSHNRAKSFGAVYAVLFSFVATGIVVAYIGFCDPDTCWHLALGQWMLVHNEIPHVDPFCSNIGHFVFVGANLPLIQHEWLSDVVFYAIFSMFGLTGMLVVTAVLSILSFVVIPSVLMLRNGAPTVVVLVATTLTLLASAFRLWVRPEEFSFLCMAALILVNDVSHTTNSRKKLAFCCVLIFSIMALWANLHGLFIVGVAYLVGYSVIGFLEFLWLRKPPTEIVRLFVIVAAAITGTINTPWHFAFWKYMLKLLTFPVSNRENGPMTLSSLANPTSLPLVLLLILVFGRLYWCLNSQKESLRTLLLPLGLSLCATAAMIAHQRITPLALLVLLASLGKTYHRCGIKSDTPASGNDTLLSARKRYFAEDSLLNSVASLLIGLAASGITCWLATLYLVPPSLPAASRLFRPPFKAVQYLEQHTPKGRLLNDSKFGSMMTWDMANPPDLFLDGRFDSLDRDLISDYSRMRQCHGNWEQLLDKYRIGWVFFPPEMPIITQLSKNPAWKTEYKDEAAAVLVRNFAGYAGGGGNGVSPESFSLHGVSKKL
jgi:hypothetical protein